MQQIGPYQVLGELGRGAAGVVYRARDPRVAEREVAIKVISLPPEKRSSTLDRFLREAEALARVDHRGVVRVHGLERHPGGAYLIQELIEGQLLEDRIKQGPLDPSEAARIVRSLADALTAVHRVGILHRDLKPGNVMLRDGEPVLLDFGVARDANAETLTQTGAMLGTPAYMSPEQAAGEPVAASADVYSLGVILYELLTGLRPFRGSVLSVVKQVLDDQPTWPSELGRDVPPALEAVLRMAMAKLPHERYESAEALREDLDRYQAGRTTQATVHAPAGPGSQRLVLIAILALGAAVAAAALWIQSLGADPASTQPSSPEQPPVELEVVTPSQPEVRHLWAFTPGDEFRVRLTFDERGTGQVRMDATVEAVVDQVDGETAHLILTVPEITARFGMMMGGESDLDQPSSDKTLLSKVLKKAMAPFMGKLNLRTGEATLSGLEVLQQGILAQPAEIKKLESPYQVIADKYSKVDLGKTLCKIFSAEYLGASMDALTRVVDAGWQELGEGDFELIAKEEAPRLRFMQLDEASQGEVRVEGSATYADGRLKTAVMQQTLLKREGITTRWTWTLLD